jgi:hypothetical protein
MAKKKGGARVAERPGQTSIINLKGTGQYREWLSGVSRKTHIPAASIVRLALADWAAKNGHPSPPEK